MKYGFLALLLVALLWAAPASAAVEAGIDVDVHSASVCPCATLTTDDFDVFIKNLDAREQTYDLEMVLPDNDLWSGFIVPALDIQGNGIEKASAFITPSCWVKPGVYEISVKAVSEASGKVTEKSFEVEVLKCRWVEAEPAEYDLCQGKESTGKLVLRNTGSEDERIKLSADADWVTVPDDAIDIASGAEKTVDISFLPPDTGVKNVNINMESELSYVRNSVTLQANSRECYKTEFSVEPERQDVCPCGSAEFMLHINNTGLMGDEYTVNYGTASSVMEIDNGSSAEVSLSIAVPCDKDAGEYPVSINIDSNAPPIKSSVVVGVRDKDMCYSVDLAGEDEKKVVNVGESATFAFVITNRGMFPQKYDLVLDAPSWAHLSESEIELDPDSMTKLYLYASPGYETNEGNYTMSLSAVSENEQAKFDFVVDVTSNFSFTEIGPNDTETPSVTGHVSGTNSDSRWSQIILISILGIAVVFILVLRFVVLIG